MTMEELVRRMDESFVQLRKLHNREEVEQIMMETVTSLLEKIEQRDEKIAQLRAEIKRLTEEHNRGHNQ